MEDPWVVWSFEHDMWWGPNRNGYYASLMLAGVYSKDEAVEIEINANKFQQAGDPHEQAIPLKSAVEFELDRWIPGAPPHLPIVAHEIRFLEPGALILREGP